MGLVNFIVLVENLEVEGIKWGLEILEKSSIVICCLKAVFNVDCDG